MRAFSFTLLMGLVVMGSTVPRDIRAQQDDDDPLRGRVFEIGPVLGGAVFSDKAGLDGCRWAGLRVGHRFEPFSGAERLQAGFRAGWEGCFTDHEEIGRVDVIHLALTWMLGLRLSEEWRVYWGSGVGEVLGDSTPGPDNQVIARFAAHLVPGATWAPSRRLLVDVSLTAIIFEDFEFGANPPGGTTVAWAPALFVAIQL